MVEVFKTNITSERKAEQVLQLISSEFPSYKVDFDLEDCDNILRVENKNGTLKVDDIIYCLLRKEVLVEILLD